MSKFIFVKLHNYFVLINFNCFPQSNATGIPGNFKGDGMQSGGTLVIEKGGKVLLSHKQKNPGDHVELKDILESLGIDKGTVCHISGYYFLFTFKCP